MKSPSSQAEEVLKGCERAPGSHSAHSVRPSSRSPAAADRGVTTPPFRALPRALRRHFHAFPHEHASTVNRSPSPAARAPDLMGMLIKEA
ncbi:hypothetical protein KOW79_008914 [Hemibagrus wyckioides]|uniref:Uncharacterized protein n=1 Tax=Hemibagrus wyckioides TaxID=337641 RepID=A0A9D3NQQ9_9TELE|nr:hypothetical protein KOW79_008914 [Hemibagrus wyckioides]